MGNDVGRVMSNSRWAARGPRYDPVRDVAAEGDMATPPDAIALHEGQCESCRAKFRYRLIHAGFNETIYAYCEQCGMILLLDTHDPRAVAQRQRSDWAGAIDAAIEPLFSACPCGGRCRRSASPRCPRCRQRLDPTIAAEWIERQAEDNRQRPGSWKWQRNWTGCYCIAIEVKDRTEAAPR